MGPPQMKGGLLDKDGVTEEKTEEMVLEMWREGRAALPVTGALRSISAGSSSPRVCAQDDTPRGPLQAARLPRCSFFLPSASPCSPQPAYSSSSPHGEPPTPLAGRSHIMTFRSFKKYASFPACNIERKQGFLGTSSRGHTKNMGDRGVDTQVGRACGRPRPMLRCKHRATTMIKIRHS